MAIIRKVFKIGESFSISIPKEIREYIGIKRGDYVVWNVGLNETGVLEKLTPKKHPGYFKPKIKALKHGK